jgi:hypothetical protein
VCALVCRSSEETTALLLCGSHFFFLCSPSRCVLPPASTSVGVFSYFNGTIYSLTVLKPLPVLGEPLLSLFWIVIVW